MPRCYKCRAEMREYYWPKIENLKGIGSSSTILTDAGSGSAGIREGDVSYRCTNPDCRRMLTIRAKK